MSGMAITDQREAWLAHAAVPIAKRVVIQKEMIVAHVHFCDAVNVGLEHPAD